MAMSERLQMQKMRDENSGNGEEHVLVFFEDENRYAVVKMDKVIEKNFTFGDTVHVQWGRKKGARPYPAKLLFCGCKEECEKEVLDLTISTENNEDTEEVEEVLDVPSLKRKRDNLQEGKEKKQKESSLSPPVKEVEAGLLNDEVQKLTKLVDEPKNAPQRAHRLQERKGELSKDLSCILQKLKSIENKVDKLLAGQSSPCTSISSTPISWKEKSSLTINSDDEEEDASDLVYNEIDLLALKAPPKEPTRYATKVAGVIFTKEELLGGMVPPVNDKYDRMPLDADRLSLLKRCIARKYSEKVLTKHWNDFRRAVNQKCNDLRKKELPSKKATNQTD